MPRMSSQHHAVGPSPIGVIAEDDTDCDVVSVLVRRILPPPLARLRVMRRRAEGCASLRRKAKAWMRDLAASGCTSVVLLHDCDKNDESTLRSALARIETPSSIARLICIPVEELEAWFWSDPVVVTEVGRGTGKVVPEPHRLKDPKEALIRLSRDEGRKPLYSVNDNKELAELLDLDLCERRCPAFRDLRQFVLRHGQAAAVAPGRQRSNGADRGRRKKGTKRR